MSIDSSSPTRRKFLANSALATSAARLASGGVFNFLAPNQAAASNGSIRPFRVDIPEEALVDLRRRILATRWPDQETVDDRSQGVQLAKLRPLVEYWGAGYDWRKIEAKINAQPQFVTEIDGLRSEEHTSELQSLLRHSYAVFCL